MFIQYFSEDYLEGRAIKFALRNIFKEFLLFSLFSLVHSFLILIPIILILLLGSLFDFSSWSFKLSELFGTDLLIFQNVFFITCALNLLIIFKLFFLLSLNGFALRKILTGRVLFLDFFFTFRFIKESFLAYLSIAILFVSLSLIYFSFFLFLKIIFSSNLILDLAVFLFILLSLYFLTRLIFLPHCLISFGSSAFDGIKQSWRISQSHSLKLINFFMLLIGFCGIFVLGLYCILLTFKQLALGLNFPTLSNQVSSFLINKSKLLAFSLVESDFYAQRFLLENRNLFQQIFFNLKSFLVKNLLLDLFFAYLALGFSRVFCGLYLSF